MSLFFLFPSDTLTQLLQPPPMSLFFKCSKWYIQHDMADKTDQLNDLQDQTTRPNTQPKSCSSEICRSDKSGAAFSSPIHCLSLKTSNLKISKCVRHQEIFLTPSLTVPGLFVHHRTSMYQFKLQLPPLAHTPSLYSWPRTTEVLAESHAYPSRYLTHLYLLSMCSV